GGRRPLPGSGRPRPPLVGRQARRGPPEAGREGAAERTEVIWSAVRARAEARVEICHSLPLGLGPHAAPAASLQVDLDDLAAARDLVLQWRRLQVAVLRDDGLQLLRRLRRDLV